MLRALSGLMLALGMTTAALAADIEITDAVARATPPGAAVGGVYMNVRNHGSEADRLLSAAAPVAERVELHTHTEKEGVARMHEVPAVEIPAGQTVHFAPGSLHVMLQDLKAPLKAGESFRLTLRFERAGEQTVTVAVKDMAAMMPHGKGHGGHGKHH